MQAEKNENETRDANGFSQYDAERILRAKKQLDEGKGTIHELIED